jgi:hypothetical protein
MLRIAPTNNENEIKSLIEDISLKECIGSKWLEKIGLGFIDQAQHSPLCKPNTSQTH